MRTIRCQLVIQFPEELFTSHDELVAFEDRLIACMPRTCEVDGHDIGSGTVNFFVHTSAPVAAHATFRKYLGTRKLESRLRVAYRELDGETFTNLWPRRDPRPFRLVYGQDDDPFARGAKRVIPKRRAPTRAAPKAAVRQAAEPSVVAKPKPTRKLPP